MRTDSGLSPTLRDAKAWKSAVDRRGILQQSDKSILSKSFSGHERNHLFYNVGGTSFQELSGISGLDTPADSRSWAWLDYDHDGWLDVALVNANRPLLNLFRNQIGQLGSPSQFVAIRLFGGNGQAQPSDYSSRDAYGAVIVAAVGERSLMREHRCGEGFAAQNSSTVLLGIGEAPQIDRLDIRWPSGRKQTFHSLPAGKLVSIYENPAHSPDGSGLQTELYIPASSHPSAASGTQHAETLTAIPRIADPETASLRLYTTMATWCPACKKHLPQFADLRARLRELGRAAAKRSFV